MIRLITIVLALGISGCSTTYVNGAQVPASTHWFFQK